jgi:dTDP-4-dehydrorhamnose reductase
MLDYFAGRRMNCGEWQRKETGCWTRNVIVLTRMERETDKAKAWVTGAAGLIGHHLMAAAPKLAPDYEAVGLSRAEVDLLDFKAVDRLFDRHKPSMIVHCAALSKSPECQANPARARAVNVEATRHLASLAEGIALIFFSSDLVFDGSKGDYSESEAVNPLSVYGETKAEAEAVVLRNPLHSVVRTSLNGGTSPSGNRGFNEEMRHAWRRGETVRLFGDEYRAPIPASETARVIWTLALLNRPGLYHVAGGERLSRSQIGQLVAARWPGLNPKIEVGSLKDYRGAPRAPDTSLDCSKVQALLPFRIPGLTSWLQEHPEIEF